MPTRIVAAVAEAAGPGPILAPPAAVHHHRAGGEAALGTAAALGRAVDAGRLLCHLEQYERTGLPSDGRLLAEDCRYLALAADEAHRQLGHRVEARMPSTSRASSGGDQRRVDQPPGAEARPENAPVHDSIQGVPVRGESLAASELGAIGLIPDSHRVRLALEVSGEVASLTSSTSGPATFVTDGEAMRRAVQPHGRGPKRHPPVADRISDNNAHLRRVHTKFGGWPILGHVVHEIAENQFEQRANRWPMPRSARRSRRRPGSGSTRRATPSLRWRPAAARDRARADGRPGPGPDAGGRGDHRGTLCDADSPGGRRPVGQPHAPAAGPGQQPGEREIHETVLNNVIHHLDLDGQTFTLPELDRASPGVSAGPSRPGTARKRQT